MLPVMNHRETIGQAATKQGAARLIRRTVNVPTGARLDVWRRPAHIADILGLPVAWVWSISWGAK